MPTVNMDGDPRCQSCGVALTGQAVGELCANCLLKLALEPAGEESQTVLSPEDDGPLDSQSAIGHPQSAIGGRVRYFGDYELVQEIARGGMGVVYKARQVSLNRIVALKMILAGDFSSTAMVQRFQTEAEAAARLEHPNIVPIYEIGTHDGQHYFSMRFVEGGSLAQKLARSSRRKEAHELLPLNPQLSTLNRTQSEPPHVGCYSPKEAAELMVKVARAVHHAHQHGILHRDLKPGNILLDPAGEPHVADFGLAKILEHDSALTQSAVVMGTPSYMAPEQAAGQTKQLSTAADVYSLGAILYELLTRRAPFRGPTPAETMRQVMEVEPQRPRLLNTAVDRDLETVCLKCLEKDPQRRYGSAEALAEDLERWLAQEPIVARSTGTLERVIKWARRKPTTAALVGMTCVAVLALIGVLLAQVAFQAEQSLRKKVEAALQTAEQARQAEEQQRKLKELALADAERARSAEADAKAKETQQRRIAEAALVKLEKSQYFRRIAWAQREWEANNVAYADQLLDECPPELRHWEWHYLKRLCHSEVLTLTGFTNGIQALAVTTNGHHIAAVGSDGGSVKIWDATTGLENLAFSQRLRRITSLAFNPSGTHLVTGGTNGVVEAWEIRTASKSWGSQGHGESVSFLAFSADGRRLVSAGRDGTITILDGDTGESVRSPLDHGEAINSVAISSDGKLIASSSGRSASVDRSGESVAERPGSIKVWDARTGLPILVLSAAVNVIHGVAFSPDDKRLASAHEDGTVKLWDVKSGKLESTFHDHLGAASSVAFDTHGTRLVSGGADRVVSVRVLSTNAGRHTYRGHIGAVQTVAFVPAFVGSVVSGGSDGLIKVWDVSNAQEAKRLNGGGSDVTFAPDSQSVATKSGVWNVLTAKEDLTAKGAFRSSGTGGTTAHGRVKFGPNGQPITGGYGVAVSPDGKAIASCLARTAKIRDFTTGTEIDSFSAKTNDIYDLAFSPDGKLLALATGNYGPNMTELRGGGQPGAVELWDWKAHRLIRTLEARRFAVWGLVFSSDGKRLASAGGLYKGREGLPRLGEVQVWNVETGDEIFDLAGVSDNVFNVAFSPDGKRLIAASGRLSGQMPVEVKIWDMESGLVVFTLRGFDRTVDGVAFSPDGKRVATVGGGALKIFSSESREFDPVPGLRSAYESYSRVLADTNVPPDARSGALLNRSQVLKHLKRPAEALADLLSARNIPQRPSGTPANLLDLSTHYNAGLNEVWHIEGSPLSSLPTGNQKLAGVDFDVRGLIQVGANSSNGTAAYSKQVSGIIVGRQCENLHFLHAAIYAGSTTNGVGIGSYVIHYADGQRREIPIRVGIEVGDWWTHAKETNTQFTVAWTGTNEASLKRDRSIRLFMTTWKNPHPEVEIATIDFLSSRNASPGRTVPAPFLVAITAEP